MLYEPTNIIPSTMTQTGTVAATTDNVNIQWQVNGNSAMTMFQIDVMQNNADSTFVYSTGVVTENPTVAQGYSLPFYGKDRFGDYVQFIYQPNQTWAAWSGTAISDGNNYKFRITQFFQENGTACKVGITSNLSDGTTYYFSFPISGMTKYVSFAVANASYFVSGNTIYFNFSHNAGWVVTSGNNSRIITDITFSVSDTQPMGAQLSGAVAVSSGDTFYNQFFTAQNSASSFITRTEPTLTITPLTELHVASASQNFTATYSQEQGDNINTVRWQLFNADDMNMPVDDTGDISTSVLSYEYNGLFDGQSYSVICTVTTESGVSISASLDFSVQYEQGTYTGNFTAQLLCQEDANLLKWDSVLGIPGVANPKNSAVVANGQLSLAENGSVTWSQQMSDDGTLQPLNIQKPWTAVWNGALTLNISGYNNELDSEGIRILSSVAFNPTGTLLVVAGGINDVSYTGDAYYFTATNQQLVYKSELPIVGDEDNTYIIAASFNSAGDTLILAKGRRGGISYYSVSNEQINYVGEIDLSSVLDVQDDYCYITDAVFSPSDSNLLIVSGKNYPFNPPASGGNWIKYTLKQDDNFSAFVDVPNAVSEEEESDYTNMTFNEDGTVFVVALWKVGDNRIYLKMFNVQMHSFTFVNTTEATGANLLSMSLRGEVFVCAISQGTSSVLQLYSVTETGLIFQSQISYNNFRLTDLTISKDATSVICVGGTGGGDLISQIKIYKIYNGNISFLTDLPYAPNPVPQYITKAIFNPIDSMLVTTAAYPGTVAYYSKQTLFVINSSISIEKFLCEVCFFNQAEKHQLFLTNNTMTKGTITLTSNNVEVFSFNEITYLGKQELPIAYEQPNIFNVELQGEQTCNYFAIIDGDGTNIEQYLTDSTFVPEWNNAQGYVVDLLADFNYGLDGGTATATGTGFRLYRRTADGTENIELATLPSTTIALRDYGIKSNESYIYDFYVYDANGAFMGVRSTEATPLKRQFKRFSLLSTQYNESDNCYHVVKEYQFSCNIQDMTVSNNSNKSYVQNFTPYPTVFQSTANYASGTLQALIGFVDMKAYKYWDSTQLMDELNALSTTANTLFLKDMKGHLWMVDVGTVQMTATQKTREMQVTISLPWTEIGDASDVSIIQTPDDEGWNYGEQVLDVKLDVDVNTGLLYVTYPFPYNGTAFYLVGTNPVGSENIVQSLPETASSPQDGILKAKVRDK